MFLKCYGCQIEEWNTTLHSTDFDELCRISTCILQTFQPDFSQIGVSGAEIWIFFVFISSKKLKRYFLKSTFSKFTPCSTDFDELCRISTRILQKSHSQISSKLVWAVLRLNFFVFISSKNLKCDFLKSTFFKIRTLYACFSDSIEQYALYSSGTR